MAEIPETRRRCERHDVFNGLFLDGVPQLFKKKSKVFAVFRRTSSIVGAWVLLDHSRYGLDVEEAENLHDGALLTQSKSTPSYAYWRRKLKRLAMNLLRLALVLETSLKTFCVGPGSLKVQPPRATMTFRALFLFLRADIFENKSDSRSSMGTI